MVEQQTHILPVAGSIPAPVTTVSPAAEQTLRRAPLAVDWYTPPPPPSRAGQAAAYAAHVGLTALMTVEAGIQVDALFSWIDGKPSPGSFTADERTALRLGAVVGGAMMAAPVAGLMALRPRFTREEHFISIFLTGAGAALFSGALGLAALRGCGYAAPGTDRAVFAVLMAGCGLISFVGAPLVIVGAAIGACHLLINPDSFSS